MEEYKRQLVLFEREYKRVEPYRKRRALTADLDKRKEYKTDLVRTYNALVDVIRRNISALSSEETVKLQDKHKGTHLKLQKSFDYLKLTYDFDENIYRPIDISKIIEETVSDIDDDDDNNFSINSQSSIDGNKIVDDKVVQIQSSSVIKEPEKLQNNLENNSRTENTDTMPQTREQFITLAHQTIGSRYGGDPISLASFCDAVELLKDLTDEDNKVLLLKYVKTKLEGKAREIVGDEPASVDDIIKSLKESIKPESSKVIEGRILALRADKSSLIKFSEQAEKLAEQFQRSLCVEGYSKEKAKEITIAKTVEMCRKSARNDTVKSVLAASAFSDAKEVIAKMITEINNVKQEKPTTSYGHKYPNNNKNNSQHSNGNRNHSQNHKGGNGRKNYSQSNHRNGQNGNRNYNNNYNSQNNRGNYSGNRSQNEQPVRMVSGNESNPGNSGMSLNNN